MRNRLVKPEMTKEKIKNPEILLANECLTKTRPTKLSTEKKEKKKKLQCFLRWWVNGIINLITDTRTNMKTMLIQIDTEKNIEDNIATDTEILNDTEKGSG